MHKFMSAIGFKSLDSKKKLQALLSEVVMNAETRQMTLDNEESFLAEFGKDFAENTGIKVCGEFDDEEKFIYEYYYPYLKGTGITSGEDISVERHAEKKSFAGICDEINAGISLIFYLKNRIPYVKAQATNRLPVVGTTVTLSGLSVNGTILLPIKKNAEERERVKKASVNRSKLMAAARQGDEEAIETLTTEDMDIVSAVSKRITQDDVMTLVDTYLMPYGVECDQYSILGEIVDMKTTENRITGEKIYILSVFCNELTFDVAINIMDLFGEPQVGRRFRGIIWLQGDINFPEETDL